MAVALRRSGQGALEAGLSVLLDRLSGLWMLWVLAALAAAWGMARRIDRIGRDARITFSVEGRTRLFGVSS